MDADNSVRRSLGWQTAHVNFKAPKAVVDMVDEMVRRGCFRSRSDAFRRALILLINAYYRKCVEGSGGGGES